MGPIMPDAIFLTVKLPFAEAAAFAQFLERVDLDDYRAKCAPHDQAELMQAAGERLREALAAQGCCPR